MLLFLLACDPLGPWSNDDPDGTEGPRLVMSPASLDFGVVSATAEGSRRVSFQLFNVGDAPVTVSGHDEVLGSDAAVFDVDAPPLLELQAGASVDVPVWFTPGTEGDWLGHLVLEPAGETLILTGEGVAPVMSWSSPTVEAVVLGCSGAGSIEVENRGSEALTLSDVQVDSAEFVVESWPDSVAPGEQASLMLRFEPDGVGERGAVVSVKTNDPLQPEQGLFVEGIAYEGERVEEQFWYTPSNPTDILLVADGGDDTRAAFDKLPAGVAVFVDHIRSSNLDYHLTALAGGPCPDSAPAWVERGDTTLANEALIERELSDDDSAWDEALLELAAEAIGESGPGGCLDGFRRDEADLYVVVIGDGPAWADPAAPLAELDSAVSAPLDLRVSALIPLSAGCGGPVTPYEEAATQTEGTLADYCADDWRDNFGALAALPSGSSPVQLELAEAPMPDTLEVYVDGARWTAWSYDAAARAVVFDGADTPALGAEVRIRYVLAVACQ